MSSLHQRRHRLLHHRRRRHHRNHQLGHAIVIDDERNKVYDVIDKKEANQMKERHHLRYHLYHLEPPHSHPLPPPPPRKKISPTNEIIRWKVICNFLFCWLRWPCWPCWLCWLCWLCWSCWLCWLCWFATTS